MSIAENVARIKAEMAAAAVACGRDPGEIQLCAATKMNDADAVRQAIAAGVDCCGENRVQELVAKLAENAYEGAPVHFIGHLQTNKVKYLVGKADLIHSVDSEHLAEEIARQSIRLGITTPVLVQINAGEETSKSGVSPAQAPEFFAKIAEMKGLSLRGMMVVAPICDENTVLRKYFQESYRIFIDFFGKNTHNIREPILSMGMSDSYEIAVEEGATEVRVGSALFGRRLYPPKP